MKRERRQRERRREGDGETVSDPKPLGLSVSSDNGANGFHMAREGGGMGRETLMTLERERERGVTVSR